MQAGKQTWQRNCAEIGRKQSIGDRAGIHGIINRKKRAPRQDVYKT